MGFRITKGIISDTNDSNPELEADVIMTTVTLGFATSLIQENQPVRLDTEPGSEPAQWDAFNAIVAKINNAVTKYLKANGLEPKGKVAAGLTPDYTKGAVIMGVYKLADQEVPVKINEPVLSAQGKKLYDKIVEEIGINQYTGRGGYTGFVDNKNTEGDTMPVGPRSTARFVVTKPENVTAEDLALTGVYPRWLPARETAVWKGRLRKGTGDSYVPWGIIGGEKAILEPEKDKSNVTGATNEADRITGEMKETDKMVFVGEPTDSDIAAYTHGMIQAIYKGYALGPSCTPYEIAVGKQTTKMASCLPCTLFMVALGYPPTSIHLGRGESWSPLFKSYNPNGSVTEHELEVVRDLNNSWREKCHDWMTIGLKVMNQDIITENHINARQLLIDYLKKTKDVKTVASTLILDAVTMHQNESNRINNTLK